MSIKKVDAKVDFIASEHEILSYWAKNKIFEKRGSTTNVIDQYLPSLVWTLPSPVRFIIQLAQNNLKLIFSFLTNKQKEKMIKSENDEKFDFKEK